MKARSIIAGLVVVIAVAIVIFYKRREQAEVVADLPGSGSTTSTPAPSGSASPKPEKVRKIDATRRRALLDRIDTARTSRAGGKPETGGGTSGTTTKTPPPSLPSLPGTISKDDIRAGVRAVIPLLAECYDAAQARLTTKEGKIVVKMHLTGEPDVGTLIDKADIEGDAHFTADKDLVECFQQTMLSVELPPIAEGGTIDVTYPIAFAP